MKTWRAFNLITGHVVFGLPALTSLPALAATIARFGLLNTLTTALLPALVVIAPWLLWLRYTRHRPTTRRAISAWLTLALLVAFVIAVSPLWFWNIPVMGLMLSETLRLLADRHQAPSDSTALKVRS